MSVRLGLSGMVDWFMGWGKVVRGFRFGVEESTSVVEGQHAHVSGTILRFISSTPHTLMDYETARLTLAMISAELSAANVKWHGPFDSSLSFASSRTVILPSLSNVPAKICDSAELLK